MITHPLAEVFGFAFDDHSERAERYRRNRLCPYNNNVANCTKDKANDPLGICSIFEADGGITITCPARFRQDWLITEDAAAFFFPSGTTWTSLAEVRLNDRHGKSAGNIDFVLVAYDKRGHILDFGALEVQAVYISGNIRRPFEVYMRNPAENQKMNWMGEPNYPRPDYLSSSRKRLVPQLMYKGGILKSWGKKQAVALHQNFYTTLPRLSQTDPDTADIVWLIYDLELAPEHRSYNLRLKDRAYTRFETAIEQITVPESGPLEEFLSLLQEKLDSKLENDANPPDVSTLADLL